MRMPCTQNRTSRWVLTGAVGACGLAVLALNLGLGVSSVDAEVIHQPCPGGIAAGVHPAFEGASVREFVPGELTLTIDLRWECRADRIGIARAAGWVHFWGGDDLDEPIRVACDLGSPVQSDGATHQRIDLPWNEHDPVHQWLRSADPGSVRTAFVAEWAQGAARRSNPSVVSAPGAGSTSPFRSSR